MCFEFAGGAAPTDGAPIAGALTATLKLRVPLAADVTMSAWLKTGWI